MLAVKPRGEKEVRAALLEAAAACYTSGEGFSVRTIAAKAGINHGLIQHYFGGKGGLKAAMLEHLSEHLLAKIKDSVAGNDLGDIKSAGVVAALEDPRYVLALARTLLDEPGETIQRDFPVLNHFESAGGDMSKAESAEGLAKILGWIMFRPYLTKALRLDNKLIAEIETRLAGGAK